MDPGEELNSWLQDKSRERSARFNFAIRALQSADFVYASKYDIIIKWVTKILADKKEQELPVDELLELFSLRAEPGLVSVSIKTLLMQALLKRVQNSSDNILNKSAPQLLQKLLSFELMQDALRADYDLLTSSYGTLFTCYERLLLRPSEGESAPRHGDFVLPVLQQLRNYVQHAQNQERLLQAYTAHTLQPLCELVLQLREHDLCCFEQLAALEKQLTEHLSMPDAIARMSKLPLHVQLLTLECSLFNQMFEPVKKRRLLQYVFNKTKSEDSKENVANAKDLLALATHALETLHKHNIPLQFQSTKGDAVAFVAKELRRFVQEFKDQHLSEVLLLLCAALRLNPLLVEPNVYQITVWMLCAPKQTEDELNHYSAYVVLLLDMFRRLSRAERFFMQLLKSLREWLSKFKLQQPAINAKRRRLCSETAAEAKEEDKQINNYVQLILKYNKSSHSESALNGDQLAHIWPSQTAGAAFTRLISHLMSKPSIVIWKMLLHTLAELLEPKTHAVLPENLSFAIELQATLLGQYLVGTRLAEQAQYHQQELNQQRIHTAQVLQQFGRHLLALEHNRRTMNVFLECVERAVGFELTLAYYWPDGLEQTDKQTQQLLKFLPSAEWELIQQRVHNFGKSSCRQRLQRLELQLIESGWLLLPNQRQAACPDALVELVPSQLLGHLTRAQKQQRVQQCIEQVDLFEDEECVELLAMRLLQDYVDNLKTAKVKNVFLAKQLPDVPLDVEALANAIRQNCHNTKPPTLPLEPTQQLVEALQQLPLSQLVNSVKSKLWLLIFSLYHDVQRAQLTQQAEQLLEQLIDQLHFGQPLPACSYFPDVQELLQLVPVDAKDDTSPAWRFYETIFERCIRRLGADGCDLFLANCTNYLEQLVAANQTLSLVQWRLLLLAIGTTSVPSRRMGSSLQSLLNIFGQLVAHEFRLVDRPPADYKDFVQTTLSGYATYLSSSIASAAKPKINGAASKATANIDEELRRICKIYIGHSLNYRNSHAIRLLNVALTHRQVLHLDLDEIEFVLNHYWQQLNADIASAAELDIRNIEPAIKLIISYKTNEDFLLILRRLTAQIDAMQTPNSTAEHAGLQNVLILLTLFAKCSLSSVKGAMLNEHFELISGNVDQLLPAASDATYRCHVMRLLEAQRALAGNRTVPLSADTLDLMLGSMLDMKINHFIIAGGAWSDFLQLHAAISENCLLLLRQHGALMSDRAAQLTTLCRDLIHAIVCYRSERKYAQSLSEKELDGLAELGLKVVTLIAGIASTQQALAVKRVAPLLLIFTINLMVTTERPTTLYEQVKVQLSRVCHELISLCDHRSGHFILRSSNEAGSRMYQNLFKEHEKYHKFRGKV